MRIVIELKRDVNAAVVLNYLYKHTQLQDTFGAIMLALVDGQPRTLNLKEMLEYYVAPPGGRRPQAQRIRPRTSAKARAHILEGLLIAQDNIDEVVRIIRAQQERERSAPVLMERFALSEKQAQAILDMRLARLTGLERERLEEELKRAARDDRLPHRRAGRTSSMVLGIIKTEISEVARALRRRAPHGADRHGRRDRSWKT